MSENYKRVLFFGTFHFPYGTAPASRILNHCKGFVENGYNVDVIAYCPTPGEKSESYKWFFFSPKIRVLYIKNEQSINITFSEKAKWFYSNFIIAKRLKNEVSKLLLLHSYSFTIVYGRNYSLLYPTMKYLNKQKVKCVLDVVELPKTSVNFWFNFNPTHLDHKIGLKKLTELASLITPITSHLKENIIHKNQFLMPSNIIWSKKNYTQINNLKEPIIITYVGNLIQRDDPRHMFEFIKLVSKSRDIKLKLVGRFRNNAQGRSWLSTIKNDPILRELCEIVGEVSEIKKQEIYTDTDVFLLSRRNHLDEIASFPTRLVEFIKQGKLIVVSPIGDIPKYLTCHDVVFLNENNIEKSASDFLLTISDLRKYNLMISNSIRKAKQYFNSKILTNQINLKVDE